MCPLSKTYWLKIHAKAPNGDRYRNSGRLEELAVVRIERGPDGRRDMGNLKEGTTSVGNELIWIV